ncbi:hypothetical protein [Sphingobacterium kyonggiense]
MELKNFERFNALLKELLWYPRAFISSNGSVTWDEVPPRGYYSTSWMEFFSAMNDGTFGKLSEELSSEGYNRYYRSEIEERLLPVLAKLQEMETDKGMKKIEVHIDTDRFRIYEDSLKRMSREKIIFDLIQDDEDIRDTYFIDADPSLLRSYILLTLQWLADSFSSADQRKVTDLEFRVKELEMNLMERETLLKVANERNGILEKRERLAQKALEGTYSKIEQLEESLARHMEEETSPEEDSHDIRKNNKLRIYYLYKLGFLDDGIWNPDIPQKIRARIMGAILDAGPLKTDTAIRYYKFFNSTRSAELKEYDIKNEQILFNSLRRHCPNIEFKKGQFINSLKKI